MTIYEVTCSGFDQELCDERIHTTADGACSKPKYCSHFEVFDMRTCGWKNMTARDVLCTCADASLQRLHFQFCLAM